MKTIVKLVNQDIFIDPLSWVMDWTAPYFPKVGDTLNAGIFMNGCGMTPDVVVASLKDSYRADWERDMNAYGRSPEIQLETFLNDIDLVIIRVEWDMQDGQTIAILYVD